MLHFQRKCNISGFGAPDQRERGAKQGAKCYKKMFQWGCYTFGQKSGENRGAAGAGLRADSGRNMGAEMRLFVVGGLSWKGGGKWIVDSG